jgi:hypothetical protein
MKISDKHSVEEIVTTAWGISTLSDCILYCSSPEFEDSIDQFRDKNANVFRRYSESKDPENEEQSLECTEVFQEYQQLVENLLEGFVESRGVTIKQFFAECKSSIDGDFTPLFEEHEHKWFVDMIMSWLEYSYFFNEMVRHAGSSRK